jgi:hypothetical protein
MSQSLIGITHKEMLEMMSRYEIFCSVEKFLQLLSEVQKITVREEYGVKRVEL